VTALHLAKRFVTSLAPGGPSFEAEAWVVAVLSEAELVLWRRMSGPDRRHAVGVAKRVEEALGERATPAVLAAALLHDVGKVEAGLGTFGRVAATAAGLAGRRAPTPRIERYLRHPVLGGDLLELAHSDPLTVAWAREHHLPPERWTLPPDIAEALKAADDD
jgi:hypothetical protein